MKLEPSHTGCFLKQPPPTVRGRTVAVQDLPGHGTHVVVIVPGELRAGPDVGQREERDPRETGVVGVHEHVLHEHVRSTGVLEVQWTHLGIKSNNKNGSTAL